MTARPDRREALGLAAIPAAALAFSTNYLLARIAPDLVPPMLLTFGRWAILFLLLLPFAAGDLRRHRDDLRRSWQTLVMLAATGMGVCGAALYIGGHTTTAGNLALITTISPILIVIGARLVLGERMSVLQNAGTVLAFLGVVLIVTKGDLALVTQMDFTPGDLWAVAAAVGWAAYAIILRRNPVPVPGLALLCATAFLGALILLPFAVGEAVVRGLPPFSLEAVALVVAIGAVPGFLGYRLYAHVTTVLGASRASVIGFLGPLTATLLAWLLLDERMAPYQMVGGAAVLVGVWLTSRAANPIP